jgi:hypothetical protein
LAEQSVEEIRRLARNFLVGKGGPGDLEDLKRDMETDSQLPFELLQLMQSALDEVPPAGFSPDQWKEMDARVVSMSNPLLRTGFGKFGQIFSGLFKKKSKAEAVSARLRRRGEEVEPAPASAPTAAPPVLAGLDQLLQPERAPEAEGMEEMAPIANQAPPPPPAVPVVAPAPEFVLPSPAMEEEPAKAVKTGNWTWVWWALGMGATLLAGYSGFLYWKWRKPEAPPALSTSSTPLVPGLSTPTASLVSAPARAHLAPPTGLPNRSIPVIELGEPLPSELAPRTPLVDERSEKPGDLEAKDQDGNHGFPLP